MSLSGGAGLCRADENRNEFAVAEWVVVRVGDEAGLGWAGCTRLVGLRMRLFEDRLGDPSMSFSEIKDLLGAIEIYRMAL